MLASNARRKPPGTRMEINLLRRQLKDLAERMGSLRGFL
jgi:hypothetical protein